MATAETALREILQRVAYAETLLSTISKEWHRLDHSERVTIDGIAPNLCAALTKIPQP